MNYIDIILGLILIYSLYNGFRKGLVSQAGALIGLLLGVWGAIKFSDFTKGILESKFDFSSQYTSLIAFAITFIAIVIAVNLLAKFLTGVLDALALGVFDKLLGAVFGGLKTALVLSILLFIINGFNQKVRIIPEKQIAESRLHKPISAVAPLIFSYFEKEFSQVKQKA